MAATCPHGYPQDTCVICQTLAASRNRPATDVVGTPRPAPAPRGRPDRPVPAAAGDRDVADGRPAGRRVGFTPSALLVVLAVVAVIGVAWAAAGVVFAVLRVVELVAAVVVAGGIGYRVGRARGRRER